MIWHILTIVFGALAAISAICPAPCSDYTLGGLVVISGLLALRSYMQAREGAAGEEALQ